MESILGKPASLTQGQLAADGNCQFRAIACHPLEDSLGTSPTKAMSAVGRAIGLNSSTSAKSVAALIPPIPTTSEGQQKGGRADGLLNGGIKSRKSHVEFL